MTLYEKYIWERNKERMFSIDVGFCTYILEEESLYITDIYILPEHRNNRRATKLADDLLNKVREETKVTIMLGSVSPDDPSYERNTKFLLSYGMKPYKEYDGLIYYIKEV